MCTHACIERTLSHRFLCPLSLLFHLRSPFSSSANAGVCVCVWVCGGLCARTRGHAYTRESIHESKRERNSVCIHALTPEKERARIRKKGSIHERKRARESVCIHALTREKKRACTWERESIHERKRERESACIHALTRESAYTRKKREREHTREKERTREHMCAHARDTIRGLLSRIWSLL